MISVKHKEFPTKDAALSLERYFFTEIHVEANSAGLGKKTSDECFDITLFTSVETTELEEKPSGVKLTIESDKDEEDKAYCIKVTVFGIFEFHNSVPDDKKEMILYTSGASVLYGIVREMLTNLTSRSPFLPMTLPTVTFFPSRKEEGES